jgi:alpha-ketoglutarate-dependent taurine dioxygenase
VYSYRVPAAHRTLFGSRVSFANSILGPSNNYETPRISFADDTDIPVPLLEEIATVTEKCTGEVAWNDGEVVIVDNTRVMHGRRAIVDPKRTIYNAQSYADLALI